MIEKVHATICIECGADLTAQASVSLHASISGHEFDVFSNLDRGGDLWIVIV